MITDQSMFSNYFEALRKIAQHGDAREESFYPALAEMLKTMAEKTGRKDVQVITLPRPTEAGNPDFRLWNGKDRIVGYIEAKKPTEEQLDAIEESEQLIRYRSTFENLILTNFFEFRLYRNGECVQTVVACRPFIMSHPPRSAPAIEKADELQTLLDRFLDFSIPEVFTAETLAIGLAKRTRFLRDVIALQLAQEKDAPGTLAGFFEAFQTYLIGTLTLEDFTDLFAQTITYGLFAARIRSSDSFNRRVAFDNIPHTIGVLRNLFRFISWSGLPEQLAWCVDDIAEVLAVADAKGILDRYYHEGKGNDPIVHFYETFLAQYDPAERERRGVYYTPEPVVGYIVRSIHDILKTDFGKSDGLASDGVTLLDPAAGTMTFIARATELAVTEFKNRYGSGGCEDFIRSHILKNFYAFELMMAPYAIGHLKMSFFLEELGHRLTDDERVPFYLTNTLDYEEPRHSHLPGLSALAEESRLAGVVKKQTPVLVVLGNPPYSGHSTNIGEWIRSLIETYKQVDGRRLNERNAKWLQDDYVKFIRFAQWKIDQAGQGIVGMITNHSYLENPTFRGMRRSLMRTFNDIYVLDLHGNALKKETCPDGSPDKNVFDIRQGVAIAFFIKRGMKSESAATVYHADVFGTREFKYDWLNAHDHTCTEWRKLEPSSPFYLFVPRDNALRTQYTGFINLCELCPVKVIGLFTARDSLAIQWTSKDVWQTVKKFSQMEPELARRDYNLGKDMRDWKVTLAQRDLLVSGPVPENVVPILYRPFDVRYTYYTGRSRGFICMPRPGVMRNMLAGQNLALCVGRQGQAVGNSEWNLAFCTDIINDLNLFYRGGSVMFPLYVYTIIDKDGIYIRSKEQSARNLNLNSVIITALTKNYDKTPIPEAFFYYIYAVLYSPAYRTKYAEFLKIDFPRIPFTSDETLFYQLAALGERLVNLHLLKSPELNPPVCKFEVNGNNRVEKDKKTGLRYDADTQRVYINAEQFFSSVPEEVWSYQIGGYQVCEKWLKDRGERRLGVDDIRAYCQIVTALIRTIELQNEIDILYPEVEETVITNS